MYVIVYCNEGFDSGYVYLCRALADDEIMSERKFADEIAAQYDREIDESDGYIPNCSGDLRVEFMEHVPKIVDDRFRGATCIWSGESFYFKTEC
jgi:hypothetical protein